MLSIVKQVLDNFNLNINPSLSTQQNSENAIRSAATLSAVVAAEPIPFADMLLIIPIQLKMVAHVGKIYGYDLTPARAKELALELGTAFAYGMLARQVMRGVAKTVAPVLGGVVTAPMVYGWTFALGKLAEAYFKAKQEGKILSPSERQHIAQKTLDAEKVSPHALQEAAQSLKKSHNSKEP